MLRISKFESINLTWINQKFQIAKEQKTNKFQFYKYANSKTKYILR